MIVPRTHRDRANRMYHHNSVVAHGGYIFNQASWFQLSISTWKYMQDRTNFTSLPPQIQIIAITFVPIDNVVESKLPAHPKHMFKSPKKDILIVTHAFANTMARSLPSATAGPPVKSFDVISEEIVAKPCAKSVIASIGGTVNSTLFEPDPHLNGFSQQGLRREFSRSTQ